MSDTVKRGAGIGLIVAAAILAGVSVVLWQQASDDAEDATLANDYAEVISGEPFPDEDPDRTAALAAAGLGAVLFTGGVVMLAGSRPAGP